MTSAKALSPEERLKEWRGDALRAMSLRAHRRRLIITEEKYCGLRPPEAKDGDVVAILLSCSVSAKGSQLVVHWKCFVCGIMDGEIMERVDVAESKSSVPDAGRRYQIEPISLV